MWNMDNNVFSKDDIMHALAQKGNYIDLSTLNSFFQKWKVEAIFENESGEEFFDENVIELISKNLFNNLDEQNINSAAMKEIELSESSLIEIPLDLPEFDSHESKNDSHESEIPMLEENGEIELNVEKNKEMDILSENQEENNSFDEKPRKMGILEGALDTLGQKLEKSSKESADKKNPEETEEDSDDFDDMSLLSESFEAQEKFREYILSQMAKKNMAIPEAADGSNLGVSEKAVNAVAKSLAKKIAQYVSTLCSQDVVSSGKMKAAQERNHKLEQRLKELEEQNRKLRLLLAESNKNLNSYKPSMFGLYKKVEAKQNNTSKAKQPKKPKK